MDSNLVYDGTRNAGLFIHPAILVLVLVSIVIILLGNIRHSIALMLFLSILLPLTQGFEILDTNFNLFRVLLLVGWIKMAITGNLRIEKFETTDKAIICWVIVSFLTYVALRYSIDSVINRLGFAYNAIGTYFFYRVFIKNGDDLGYIYNILAIITALVAVFMIHEQVTGKNIFYVFGGVEEYTPIRGGRLRSQGPFAHPIPAGVFGAALLPIYISMWRNKGGSAALGILGIMSAGILIITSSSTTPVVVALAGLVALFFFRLRNHMRRLRYAAIFAVVGLHLAMEAPVWALIARAAVIGESTSWHRYELVDNLFNRVPEWYLLGVRSTEHWGFGMDDLTNQYFFEAVNGGLLKIVLFIIIISLNFSIIGGKIETLTSRSSQERLWAFGSALFANIVGFIGIAYWDQMLYVWYLFLASITSTCLNIVDVRESIR